MKERNKKDEMKGRILRKRKKKKENKEKLRKIKKYSARNELFPLLPVWSPPVWSVDILGQLHAS